MSARTTSRRVSPDYKSPFSFNGKIQGVTIAVEE